MTAVEVANEARDELQKNLTLVLSLRQLQDITKDSQVVDVLKKAEAFARAGLLVSAEQFSAAAQAAGVTPTPDRTRGVSSKPL